MELQPAACDPWFEDGNLVVQAGSKRFRIHRGVLAKASPIFGDMLIAGDATASRDVYDGCPIVELLGDDPEGIENVLKALYDRSHFTATKVHALQTVLSILVVSIKYEIQQLRREALAILSSIFPLTLDDWKQAHLSSSTGQISLVDYTTSPAALASFIDAAVMIPESILQPILPVAYLRLCEIASLSEIMNLELGRQTLKKLVVGRNMILAVLNKCSAVSTSLGPGGPCQSKACQTFRAMWYASYSGRAATGNLAPIVSWTPIQIEAHIEGYRTTLDGLSVDQSNLCPGCKRALLTHPIVASRSLIWEMLPAAFAIAKDWDKLHESWKELQDSES